MNDASREQIETALRGWQEPYLGTDLVSANAVREIGVHNGRVSVELELGFPVGGYARELAGTLRGLLEALPGVRQAEV
ncbi:MAG: iron-sulfur cluster assembly protein, partial [Gammaproteobacteria bacterium]